MTHNNSAWLANPDWRRREVRFVHGIGLPVFLLGSAVSASIAFGAFTMVSARLPELSMDATGAWFAVLLLVIVPILPLWPLTRGWSNRLRFGTSVCRIQTLPGVIGGWFKADIECRLPPNSNRRVVVWLINRPKDARKGSLLNRKPQLDGVWRMTQSIDVGAAVGAQSVIPVRLKVPRDPKQFYRLPDGRLNSPGSHLWDVEPAWILVVQEHDTGRDFFAMFDVPIFDTNEAPASEQCAE